MRWHVVTVLTAAGLLWGGMALGQPLAVDPEAIEKVLQAYVGPAALETPLLVEADGGFLKFVGAPPEGYFQGDPQQKSTGPAAVAQKFLSDHAAAFGILSEHVEFSLVSVTGQTGAQYVRLQQQYDGIEVFGAQAVVQMTGEAEIGCVLSDILRDALSLDSGDVSTTPGVSPAIAENAAKAAVAALFSGVNPSDLHAEPGTRLVVFRPDVLGLQGPTRLVYVVRVANALGDIRQEALVDAASGEVVLRYSLNEEAKERHIFDAENRFNIPNESTRDEGEEPTGIADVDNTYDYLGDTYDFYFVHHERDSFDDEGEPILAVVRLPFQNAFYSAGAFYMGTGFAADDVIAHEYTHGVTDFTSQLIYFGFSGAINESFSDIWGEYVDLTNGKGDDSAAVRWFMGEDVDLTGPFGEKGPVRPKQDDVPPNAIRYMKDPTLYGDPDRLGSPLLYDVESSFDNGGVHGNSGIGNKLCYLLTDGDDFNGQSVFGFGIDRVAQLFYETQFILTPASDYEDLYLALGAASAELDFTFEERVNVAAAGRAVEIAPNQAISQGLRNLRAIPTLDLGGNPVIALTWTNPPTGLFSEVVLIRSVQGFVDNPAQGQVLLRGRTSGFLDTEVQEGVQYFYTLIADRVDGFPETEYARAIAGGVAASFTTEAFSGGSVINPTIDLAGAQLLFSPVGPPAAPIGNSSSIGTYADYEVTFTRNVFELPVPREDARGGAFLIPLTDDGGVTYLFGDRAFPFFGQLYSQVYLASNGYIGFFPVAFNSELNFPTLGAHFTIPRISYLFSDLGPNVGGTMWARGLEDRLVVTYENIPEIRLFEFGAPTTNTVQVELFYSGHIRITYQQLSTVNAIVGLSDGNGPPVDPATIFADVLSVETLTDLSAMPSTPAQLTFTPAGAQVAEAGERITFTVATVAPAGSEGVPVLTASWDGVGIVPFADNGDGTGTFNWQTELTDDGLYTLRVLATLAGEQAYQDTRLLVGETFPLPEARDLRLSTSTPGEDPTQDRVVPADTALAAEYDYFHPLATDDPELFAEGPTVLYWFRNGLVVQGLVNSSTVPASLTRGGDRWQFRVLPITESFIVGEEAVSPTVSVVELPLISSIVPGFGPTEGGTEVIIRGARLGAPLSVKFGGVEVRSVRTISSQELEVVTPIHSAGTVSVSVTTSQGTGTLRNAFIYTGDTADIVKADLNGDGKVDSTDIQIVINAILGTSSKAAVDADANRDGDVNSSDVQVVVNRALRR